ncbi:MAG: FGGY family carbohydrate kinase [Christensenella sp.]|nr:FGGY family carbohydrate kinase [Christensenella sp.]
MRTYIAIDLGTSNCRSAVFDDTMKMLSLASAEYPLIHGADGEIEQDALVWWDSVKKTIRAALSSAKVSGDTVASISMSSQGISFVPLDQNGKPLSNAVSWLDLRAQQEETELEKQYGKEKLFQFSGKRANACYTLPKLVWFAKNKPEIYEKASRILLPLDFIQYKLCGNAVTDHTMASGTMFYDIHKKTWASDVLKEQGLDERKLPSISQSGTVIGKVFPTLADELGISRDTAVVVGAQDQKCAALGAGITPRSATASLGTASCITMLSDQPLLDKELRIPCFTYLWPGTWALEGIINTAASAYQWFQNAFAPQFSFQELDHFALESAKKHTRAFFFPYLSGMTSPFWGNGTGTFSDLSLASDVGQLALAVLDGVACNIKANLDIMQSIYKPVQECRLFGGGAKSPLWRQIVADLLNIPVITQPSPETALLGAALLAKFGIDRELAPLPEKDSITEPIKENVAEYQEYYSRYLANNQKYFM